MNEKQLKIELQEMANYIGRQIDSEIRMNMDDLNELWEWIHSILGDFE